MSYSNYLRFYLPLPTSSENAPELLPLPLQPSQTIMTSPLPSPILIQEVLSPPLPALSTFDLASIQAVDYNLNYEDEEDEEDEDDEDDDEDWRGDDPVENFIDNITTVPVLSSVDFLFSEMSTFSPDEHQHARNSRRKILDNIINNLNLLKIASFSSNLLDDCFVDLVDELVNRLTVQY